MTPCIGFFGAGATSGAPGATSVAPGATSGAPGALLSASVVDCRHAFLKSPRPLGPRLDRVYVLFLLAYYPPFLMRQTAFVRSTFHSYILENGRNDHLRLSKAHYQNPSVYYNYYAII